MSEMDRLTVAGSGAFISAQGYDYLENNCVDEPVKLCEFKKLNGRILKTVDSVYQDVDSLEECRELCLNSPFRWDDLRDIQWFIGELLEKACD